MGYSVYRDVEGHDRWAGYGVPAECDWADCHAKIDRGMAYKCEEHYDLTVEDVVEAEGCGLYFCGKHDTDFEQHWDMKPKPDSPEWERHMLNDPSWQQWRDENPEKTAEMKERHHDAR